MKEGIFKALSIYIIGFGLAGLVYSIYGHPYIHAPGFHHIIIFLTLVLGVILTIGATIYFFLKQKSNKIRTYIFTNLFIILGFILFFYFILIVENQNEPVEIKSNNEITTEIKGDSMFVYHNNKIVYLKVKDSILINTVETINIVN